MTRTRDAAGASRLARRLGNVYTYLRSTESVFLILLVSQLPLLLIQSLHLLGVHVGIPMR